MSMWSLPEEIQVDIFLRLPVDSILACRCACKYWRSLIRNPKFIKDHLNLSIQSKNPRLAFGHFQYYQGRNLILNSIDYKSISSSSRLKVVSIDYPFQNKETKAIVSLGSCNGLICLGIAREAKNYICIWNPSTGEYMKIKVTRSEFLAESTYYSRYGFGYDSNMDDYKLVRFSDYKDLCTYIIDVCTIKSKCWKIIPRTDHYMFPDQLQKRLPGVLINGALHWSGTTTTKGSFYDVIVRFDINSETLRHILFPREITKPLEHSNAYREVGMLGDCLCVVFSLGGIETDVWVMQDYGVKESWTKVFTTTILTMTRDPILNPIWSFQNGDILVYAYGRLSICDPNNGNTKKVLLCGLNMSRCLESYVESLVSLESGKYVQKTRTNGSKKKSNKRQRLR